MKLIAIPEERLVELVDTMLLRLRERTGKADLLAPGEVPDGSVTYRAVHFEAHVLLDKIKNSTL